MRPCARKIKKRKCGIKLKADNRILTGSPGPIGHGTIIHFRYFGVTTDDFIGYGTLPYQTIIQPVIMIYHRGLIQNFTAKAAWWQSSLPSPSSGYIEIVLIRDSVEEVLLSLPYTFPPGTSNNTVLELGQHDINLEVKNNDQIGVRTTTPNNRIGVYGTLEYFNYST